METSLVDIRDFETISKGLESNISDFHEAVVLDNLNSIFCQPKGGGGPLLRSGIIKTIVQLLKVATNHNNLNVVEKLITSIKYICNDGEVVDLPRTLNGVNAFISVGACSGRLYQYQSCVSNSADLLMLSATFTVLVDLLMIQSPPDLDNENLKMEVFGIIMQWLKISSRSRHFLRESSVCEGGSYCIRYANDFINNLNCFDSISFSPYDRSLQKQCRMPTCTFCSDQLIG